MTRSLYQFLRELRRRKVYHVAVVYAAVAFVVWQVADIAFPSLGLPESAVGLVLALTFLGFPLALVLAWAYEVRPEESTSATATPSAMRTQPAPPGARTASAQSVAILPFENMSPEREGEYFADGITEEITNVLAGVPGLHVAARTSAFAFKGQHADIREIGQRLTVAFVVEGSVRRAGDVLRVTAQVVDTSTGYHLWSQRFDRSIGDIFEIQDEIAKAVAERLSEHVPMPAVPPVALTGQRSAALAGPDLDSAPSPRPVARTSDLSAYEAYLKGRQLLANFEAEAVARSTERFVESIELDPSFAAAHAGLAEALTFESIGFQSRPDREIMPRALREADRALDLDPRLPEAHLARALCAMYYEWDHRKAKAEFDTAVELGPSVARIHMWHEFYFTYVEHDCEQAIAANQRAQALNPLDPAPRSREGTVRYLFGDYDRAEQIFRSMLQDAPGVAVLHAGLADTLTRTNRIDEAVASMERAANTGGTTVAWLGMLGAMYGLQGSEDKGRGVLRQLEARSREGYVSHFWKAIAQAGLGQSDAAFASLDAAIADRDSNLLYAFCAPRGLGLHRDPRFGPVLRAIGLAHLIALL